MGPMGLNPPNIYVTSILVRSVQVLCTIGVITAKRVAKKAKNEGKLPFYGYFWPYGLGYGAETQTTVISIGTRDLVRV